MNPNLDERTSDVQVGQRLGRYTVTRVAALPEIEATFYELRHDLGSRHVHIAREDDNLTFTVLFPTVPRDSSGVAHILEHIVLSGSQKYPLKTPFFAMQPRSLNTFSNAFTASDWTAYPFSTRNAQDFSNLLSVYLDAAFFPLLRADTFLREAWRLEYDPLDNPAGELKVQGVVYNEMKGGMASAGSQVYQAIGKALYPDLTYAVNSGGEPRDIPDLTWEALRDFHARHYHPSNAYFYTYGDMPLPPLLDAIETQVMGQFGPLTLDVAIPDQPRFEGPRELEVRYASGDVETGAQALLAWMVAPSYESYDVLRWSVLSDVLLGNPAAPLRRALIESGLGSATADGTGYHDDFRQGAFAAGLKGLALDKADEVRDLVLDTLRRVVGEGVDPEAVDSSIHQIELSRKEVSNAGFPYGLKLFFRFAGTWLYGGDPLRALRLDEDLEQLSVGRARGGFFENMIQRELLDNPHRVLISLTPDPQVQERQAEEERARVAAMSAGFSDGDKARVVETAVQLAKLQEQSDDVSVLPTLALSDIPVEVPGAPYQVEPQASLTLARAPQPTSGLVYLDVQLNVGFLDEAQLELLPLYAYALTKSGAGDLDYLGLARRIEAVTGGVGASAGVSVGPGDLGDVRASFTLSGKALSRNAPELVAILRDLLAAPRFDGERLSQLVKQRRAGMEASVVGSGHLYARGLAAAQLGSAGALGERQDGLSQLARLKTLDEAAVRDLTQQFGQLAAELRRAPARLLLTATQEDLGLDLSPITETLPGGAPKQRPAVAPAGHTPQARTTDVPVSYHAKSFLTVPYTHPDAPALLALAHLLRSEYVLRELREKGGAYGGYATYNPQGGVFGLSSYRDPRMARTYQVFEGARDFLNSEALGERELREAVLSASGQLDPLTSPDTVARMRFFGDQAGYTAEVQEAFKARLLKVTLDDLRRVYDSYLRKGAAYGMVTGRDPNPEMQEVGLKFEVAAI